jgi:LysM repeat protein
MIMSRILLYILLVAGILLAGCANKKPNRAIFNNHKGKMPGPRPSHDNAFLAKKTRPIAPVRTVTPNLQPALIETDDTNKDTVKDFKAVAKDKTPDVKADIQAKDETSDKKDVKKKVTPYKMPEIKRIVYTVKEGDHYSSIANAYGVAAEDLLIENNLETAEKLSIGQKIFLPLSARFIAKGKRKKRVPLKPLPVVDFDSANGQKYIVKKGDYLYSIAKNYGTTIKAIMNTNKLTSDRLRVGQALIIPNKNTPVKTNTNKAAGNTLFDKTPVKKVADKDPDPIKPIETDPTPVKIVNNDNMIDVLIVEDDSLEGLAADFNTTKEAIIEANPKIKSNADLAPGLIIKVPKKK